MPCPEIAVILALSENIITPAAKDSALSEIRIGCITSSTVYKRFYFCEFFFSESAHI